jgi:hypothetical protein
MINEEIKKEKISEEKLPEIVPKLPAINNHHK